MDPFVSNGRSFDTDLLIFRSLFAIDPTTNLPEPAQTILASDGQGGLQWQDAFTNMSTFSKLSGSGIGFLPSTISTLSTSFYSLSNYTKKNMTGVSEQTLSDTVDGLGTLGYISTSGLNSIAATLFTSLDYLKNVASTTTGLGTTGYISSLTFQSTLQGLGTLGYISSPSLQSTVDGLGTAGYVNTSNLASTFNGLGTKYISTLSFQSSITSQNSILTSTIAGLGSYGYISSFAPVISLTQNAVSIDRAGNVIINNAVNVNISSVNGTVAYSNVYVSTLTYKGVNGLFIASTMVGLPLSDGTTTQDMYFSSVNLQLSSFQNYIINKSRIIADIYPNFIFCKLVDPYKINTAIKLISLSTYLVYQGTPLLATTNNSLFIASSYASSNSFQVPMRIPFKGSDIITAVGGTSATPPIATDDFVLMHRVVNSLQTDLSIGFQTSNIQVYMPSTNSVFLTIQNNSI